MRRQRVVASHIVCNVFLILLLSSVKTSRTRLHSLVVRLRPTLSRATLVGDRCCFPTICPGLVNLGPLATPPPVIGQPMMIDSSQATPTIPLQCSRPERRRRAARSPSSHSNASHVAAYRYKRPMRRGARRGLPLHAAYCGPA